MTEPIPEDKQSKISGLAGALKKLLWEDPIIFIIVVVFILPLATITYNGVLDQNLSSTAFSLVATFIVVVFLIIPLIIVRINRSRGKEINEIRLKALSLEAERRLEIEKGKQQRFNDLMDAKIENLKAQTQFIFDRSDRYEKELLEKTSKELSETINKSFTFIDKDECSANVHSILEELAKVHLDFDTVIPAINRLEEALGIEKETVKPTPKIQVVDEVKDPDETKWDTGEPDIVPSRNINQSALLAQKQADIDALVKDIEGGAKNYQLLQTEYDKTKKRLDEEESLNIKIVQENLSLEKRVEELESQLKEKSEIFTGPHPVLEIETKAPVEKPKEPNIIVKTVKSIKETILPPEKEKEALEEALGVLDTLDDDKFEDYSLPDDPDSKAFQEAKAVKELTLDMMRVAEEKELVKEPETPPDTWLCKCNRINNLNQKRCRACGAGQPVNAP